MAAAIETRRANSEASIKSMIIGYPRRSRIVTAAVVILDTQCQECGRLVETRIVGADLRAATHDAMAQPVDKDGPTFPVRVGP